MHGRNQRHAFFHPAFADDLLHLRRHVYVGAVRAGVKFQIFGKALHGSSPRNMRESHISFADNTLEISPSGAWWILLAANWKRFDDFLVILLLEYIVSSVP